MSKYIIDTDDFEPMFKVDSIGVFGIGKSVTDNTEDHTWSRIRSIEEYEVLNSDYINEHYGDLQEDAYKMGIAIGCADGRDELRKAIISIIEMDNDTREKRFGYSEVIDILVHHSASKIIKKMKDNDKIDVGDEVEVLNSGSKYLIAWIAGTSICGFAHGGVTCHLQPSDVRKTGRHFDIASILEGMRE